MDLLRRHNAGFSFFEILIAIAVIGIIAAIVIPEFLDRSQQAKESAAKENLQIVRQAIERYAAKNNGIGPGYPSDKTYLPILESAFYSRMINDGYLTTKAQNPFNNLTTIKMITKDESLPIAATGQYGWIYKATTKTFKIDWPGTDSQGESYYDY